MQKEQLEKPDCNKNKWEELDRREAELQRRLKEIERQVYELNIQEEALNKSLAMQKEQLQKTDHNKNKMEDDWIRLAQREAELQRRSEELECQECELNIQEEALNKFLAMPKEQLQKPDRSKNKSQEEQLQKPLLLQPERNKNKNYNAWDLSPIVWVIAVVSGLAFLVQMCTMLPLVYLQYIVVAFAVLWGLGSVVLSFRIFERFRVQNTLSHHAARLAFLCFTLLGLYALYLITLHLDDTSSPLSASAQ